MIWIILAIIAVTIVIVFTVTMLNRAKRIPVITRKNGKVVIVEEKVKKSRIDELVPIPNTRIAKRLPTGLIIEKDAVTICRRCLGHRNNGFCTIRNMFTPRYYGCAWGETK